MKNTLRITFALLLIFTLAFTLASCGNDDDTTSPWDDAVYTENAEFGNGSKTVNVTVKVNENKVTFTLHTDKSTVGEALIEHSLISGEEGAYGLYVKKVNGITADYDIDQSYWAFYINGEYAMTGIELTDINEGYVYEVVYTK